MPTLERISLEEINPNELGVAVSYCFDNDDITLILPNNNNKRVLNHQQARNLITMLEDAINKKHMEETER